MVQLMNQILFSVLCVLRNLMDGNQMMIHGNNICTLFYVQVSPLIIHIHYMHIVLMYHCLYHIESFV